MNYRLETLHESMELSLVQVWAMLMGHENDATPTLATPYQDVEIAHAILLAVREGAAVQFDTVLYGEKVVLSAFDG